MKILITGFGPFPGVSKNPSWTVVQKVVEENKKAGSPYEMVCHQIPVLWHDADGELGSWPSIEAAVKAENPDCLICLGAEIGINEICFETVAVNTADTLKDNAGNQFKPHQTRDVDIETDGPSNKRTTLPEQVISEYNRLYPHPPHTPVVPSTDAGTYLCNFVFYKSLVDYSDAQIPHRGFIHVGSDEQAADAAHLIQLIAQAIS